MHLRARVNDINGNVTDFYVNSLALDRVAPHSTFQMVPVEQPAGGHLLLQWDGTDDLSGLTTYDLMYKESTVDQWQPLVSETTSTSYTISQMQQGVDYFFGIRARDNAGNEAALEEMFVHSLYEPDNLSGGGKGDLGWRKPRA
ncbi:MAG: fibronectin type III domain-containing protein [Chloroflexota bacterium]